MTKKQTSAMFWIFLGMYIGITWPMSVLPSWGNGLMEIAGTLMFFYGLNRLSSSHEEEKIKIEVIRLKAKNEQLGERVDQMYNDAIAEAIKVADKALSQDGVSPVICNRVIRAILNLTAEA